VASHTILQLPVRRTVDKMDFVMPKGNVSASPDGLEITVSFSHVTLDARSMDNVRMERVSAPWDGMESIVHWVRFNRMKQMGY